MKVQVLKDEMTYTKNIPFAVELDGKEYKGVLTRIVDENYVITEIEWVDKEPDPGLYEEDDLEDLILEQVERCETFNENCRK